MCVMLVKGVADLTSLVQETLVGVFSPTERMNSLDVCVCSNSSLNCRLREIFLQTELKSTSINTNQSVNKLLVNGT